MATTYRKLDEILQANQQNNILQPQQQAQPGKPTSESAGFNKLTKDSGSGFAGGADKAPPPGPSIAKGNESQAYLSSANKNAQGDVLTADLTKQIGDAKQKLKDSADKYITGVKSFNNDFQIDDADVQKLYSGDADAYSKIQERLGKAYNIDSMAAYTPDQKEISDLQAIVDPNKRQAKLSEKFNNQFQGQYSAGMSALDSRLSADQDYSNVLKENATIVDLLNQYKGDITKQKDTAKQEYDTNRNKALTDFGSKAGTIKSSAQSQLDAFLQAENDRMANEHGNVKKQQKSELDALMAMYSGANIDPDIKRAKLAEIQGKTNDINSGKYVSTTGPQADINDFVSQKDADVFNRLNVLLGKGDGISAHSDRKSGVVKASDMGLDAYKQALQNYIADYAAFEQSIKERAATAPTTAANNQSTTNANNSTSNKTTTVGKGPEDSSSGNNIQTDINNVGDQIATGADKAGSKVKKAWNWATDW